MSLPRLKYPHNGYLLGSQAEIDEALQRADELVGQVAAAPESRRFSRVDLVWKFRVPIQSFLQAHRTAQHPHIRAEPVLRKWTSLSWAGSKMKVRMYDKRKELTKLAGDILRVEFQLQHEKLSRELHASRDPLKKLDWTGCYAAY